jgi:hypothetical protein
MQDLPPKCPNGECGMKCMTLNGTISDEPQDGDSCTPDLASTNPCDSLATFYNGVWCAGSFYPNITPVDPPDNLYPVHNCPNGECGMVCVSSDGSTFSSSPQEGYTCGPDMTSTTPCFEPATYTPGPKGGGGGVWCVDPFNPYPVHNCPNGECGMVCVSSDGSTFSSSPQEGYTCGPDMTSTTPCFEPATYTPGPKGGGGGVWCVDPFNPYPVHNCPNGECGMVCVSSDGSTFSSSPQEGYTCGPDTHSTTPCTPGATFVSGPKGGAGIWCAESAVKPSPVKPYPIYSCPNGTCDMVCVSPDGSSSASPLQGYMCAPDRESKTPCTPRATFVSGPKGFCGMWCAEPR